jgi:hypothetical protein
MRHLPVGHAEPLRSELSQFLAAVAAGTEPSVSGEEGVISLDIAMRCLAAFGRAPADVQDLGEARARKARR